MHSPTAPDPNTYSPNRAAAKLWQSLASEFDARVAQSKIAGATVFDFGVQSRGTIRAGLLMAKACMGGLADISLVPCDSGRFAVTEGVYVQTDRPVLGCLGCQYAGWPVQADDYFAMGSGPMRLARGREAVLEEQQLSETQPDVICGLLESDKLPTASAIEVLSKECGVPTERIILGVAPSTSLAGSIQIVARSAETAMHKLHELEFPIESVFSATGFAPLPPLAKTGDVIGGIGRTNDAMLYGAEVTLWVDCEDESITSILPQIPSSASSDHGKPFREIFAAYDHDFYKVDTALFSPAVVSLHNARTGHSFSAGQVETSVLRDSFGR
ncbi:MAG: methenyltetrahydromethanopterin cyclohydrolase [Planctomycetota bacterium]